MPLQSPFSIFFSVLICVPLTLQFATAAETDFKSTVYANSSLTPSPACLCASNEGDVYVGSDLNGSLNKKLNKGFITKLVDTNNDGKADKHTVFAKVDNPRGLLSVGNKLYVLHTFLSPKTKLFEDMRLTVFTDANRDGIADDKGKILISKISPPKFNRKRGADHTTNGIRMGIDGWIYIALGDFGLVDATGTDGTVINFLGGGIIRVRPDGKEMEMFTSGLRNIYDVAIDPFMNVFTRGNTNDGYGWNLRFIHHIQSADYGYPRTFISFTDEILPALADFGQGGSGAGGLYLDEHTWPKKYNKNPLMADWGRNHIYIHPLSPDQSSFTQQENPFFRTSQPSDLDVDPSGRIFVSAWAGAGYWGNPKKGFVQQITPRNWKPSKPLNLETISTSDLIEKLKILSSTQRLHIQQELISRAIKIEELTQILKNIKNTHWPLESRVASLFTYAQMNKNTVRSSFSKTIARTLKGGANPKNTTETLLELAKDSTIREWAFRAAADRKSKAKNLPLEPFIEALSDPNPRVQVVAAVALGRTQNMAAAQALLKVSNRPPLPKTKIVHATPNSSMILPHVAVKSLVSLNAKDAALAAVVSENKDGALWALKYMHDEKVVDTLLKIFKKTQDSELKTSVFSTLARLTKKEVVYDGSWWWNTKPDSTGPYYKPTPWAATQRLESFFKETLAKMDEKTKKIYHDILLKNRVVLYPKKTKPIVKKLEPIASISIENVMLGLEKAKPNLQNGKKILSKQACLACHSIETSDTKRGPDLNHIGSHLSRSEIADAILKPAATIAQNWVDLTVKGSDIPFQGTLVEKNSSHYVLRDIAGQVNKVLVSQVVRQEPSTSIMGAELLNSLTLQEFADVVGYLKSKK